MGHVHRVPAVGHAGVVTVDEEGFPEVGFRLDVCLRGVGSSGTDTFQDDSKVSLRRTFHRANNEDVNRGLHHGSSND